MWLAPQALLLHWACRGSWGGLTACTLPGGWHLPSQPGPPVTSGCWSQFSTLPQAQSICWYFRQRGGWGSGIKLQKRQGRVGERGGGGGKGGNARMDRTGGGHKTRWRESKKERGRGHKINKNYRERGGNPKYCKSALTEQECENSSCCHTKSSWLLGFELKIMHLLQGEVLFLHSPCHVRGVKESKTQKRREWKTKVTNTASKAEASFSGMNESEKSHSSEI